MTYILIILMIIAAVYFGRRELQRRAKNYTVPEPQSKRSGILYGYYGNHGDCAAQTEDHTSLLWVVPVWQQGADRVSKCADEMAATDRVVVVDLEHALFYKPDGANQRLPLSPENQELNLREFFHALRERGVLHKVKASVPIDEPNLPEHDVDAYIPDAVGAIRRVAAEFHELNGLLIGICYYYDKPMLHTELFDILGLNKYPARSGVLRPGAEYDQLRKRLRPDQRLWLFPGGTYGQDPESFVNYAHTYNDVWAIIPFIHTLPAWHTEFRGIADQPEMLRLYVAAGHSLREV